MNRTFRIITITISLVLTGSVIHADGHIDAAIKARQAQMQLYAFNLGTLGSMAKGQAEYDATVATTAASNLAALSMLDQSLIWPKGSDSGLAKSNAKIEIWTNFPDIMNKGKAMADAALLMKAAAGGGLDSMRDAMGPLGASCGGCHKVYKETRN